MGTIFPVMISFTIVIGLSIIVMIVDHITKKR
jgi:hypothetical protein